ncbi:MAG TPA: permease-like cell division protein FtsX [Polyangiaceae bacterium]|jgi:cell division transport system permease protein|nr:permease-like cell division protein FtsX [Polyangiaceae bacterium]
MHAVSVLSSAVAFMCLACGLLVLFNLERIETRWNSVGQLSVYLAPQVSVADSAEVVRALKATAGVTSVKHVTSEGARAELLEGSPSALIAALPSDAFPASIEVELEAGLAADRVQILVSQLKQLPAVESVETYSAWVARISALVRSARIVALGLCLVVFLAVVTVVGSTTKLTLESRRDEVEVLRIVGATTAYVRRPFLIEGAAQGSIGAAAAVGLTALAFSFLGSRFEEELSLLLGVSPTFLPLLSSLGLVVLGAVLGSLAAMLSLRKAFVA